MMVYLVRTKLTLTHVSLSLNWNSSALNLEQMQLRAVNKQTASLKDHYKIWTAIPHEASSSSGSHMSLPEKEK